MGGDRVQPGTFGALGQAERLTMTEKIPFFISPAYSVPRMTISFLLKLTSTEVAEVMPAVNRLAGNAPALSKQCESSQP